MDSEQDFGASHKDDEGMRILIVEDDKKTAGFVEKAFQQAGFRTCHVSDGLEGLAKATTEPFDVAVVDIMLPKLDGLSVIEGVRRAGIKFPIIVLSAMDSVESKVQGLEKGGDDYLAKPFSITELLARVQALLRRSASSMETTTLTVEDLTLDIPSRRVYRGGVRIDLQPLEYQLLEYLMRNKGRVVSRTTIMEHVWEYDFDTQTNIVESRVCRLREKIDKAYDRKFIRTVRGFGYVIE
jgi:DNA-binding response OmpR family regulator